MRYYNYRSNYTTAANIVARLEAKADRFVGPPPSDPAQARRMLGRLIREVKRANGMLDGMSRNRAAGLDTAPGRDVVATLTQIATGSGPISPAAGALRSWAQTFFTGVPNP